MLIDKVAIRLLPYALGSILVGLVGLAVSLLGGTELALGLITIGVAALVIAGVWLIPRWKRLPIDEWSKIVNY